MAEHPDLQRMRRETHELRIAEAWGIATHGRELSENARARLEAFVAPFLRERKETHPRRTAPPRTKRLKHVKQRVPTPAVQCPEPAPMHPLVVLECTMTPSPPDRVRFETRHSGFKTSAVILSSVSSGSGRRRYNGHFNIETDHNGNKLKTYRITSPPLESAPSDHGTLRRFMNFYMFEMYVRIMSCVRLYLHMEDAEVELLPVDLRINEPWVSGIDITLPPNLHWTKPNTHEDCVQHARLLCLQLGIPTPTLHNGDTDSSDDGSDDGSDDSSE